MILEIGRQSNQSTVRTASDHQRHAPNGGEPRKTPLNVKEAVSDKGTGTLGKGMEVLEIISAAGGTMRFTDILAQSRQPRGTLHRQIGNLVEEGLLTANPDHTYELGLRLLQLASTAWASNEFRQIAEPHLRDLQRLTGETIHLGVIKGDQVIYLDKVESHQSVRMHSQIGNASPIYCTGVGKAALSAFDDQEIRTMLANVTFSSFTATTLASMDALIREMADIRSDGIAWDREEHEPGIHCVAAPVHSTNRHIAAGISVTAPAFRITRDQLFEFAPTIRSTANAIMKEMAARLSPRS